MKKKMPLNQRTYLPEYFEGNVAESFQKEVDQRILYWDFDKALDEKIKVQIEILLNEIVRTIKNREDRRNRYLLLLKCLFANMKAFVQIQRDLLYFVEKHYLWNLWRLIGKPIFGLLNA